MADERQACPQLAQLRPVYVHFNKPAAGNGREQQQTALIFFHGDAPANEDITTAVGELTRELENFWTPGSTNSSLGPKVRPTYVEDVAASMYAPAIRIVMPELFRPALIRKLMALVAPRYPLGSAVRIDMPVYQEPEVTIRALTDDEGPELYAAFRPLYDEQRPIHGVTVKRVTARDTCTVQLLFPEKFDKNHPAQVAHTIHRVRDISPIYLNTMREV